VSFRNWAERWSRGIVLRRHLPARFGRLPIYVTPEAGLRYWLTMAEVDLLLYRMAEELVKPGSIVWDVGSNVGLFSLCAAFASGRSGFVLAIEPDVWLAYLITRSSQAIARHPCAEVQVLCAAVSNSNGVSSLEIAQRARASNHLIGTMGSSQARGRRFVQPTVSLTLDSLLEYFPAPTVLKIDVETHETNVLGGAGRLLNQIRPMIWCEVSHENSADVSQLLHGAGYELYGAETVPHPQTNRAWFQTLAIPGHD